MFRGIRGQRKAAKKLEYAEADDAGSERQTNPLKEIGHSLLGAFPGHWSRQTGDRFTPAGTRFIANCGQI